MAAVAVEANKLTYMTFTENFFQKNNYLFTENDKKLLKKILSNKKLLEQEQGSFIGGLTQGATKGLSAWMIGKLLEAFGIESTGILGTIMVVAINEFIDFKTIVAWISGANVEMNLANAITNAFVQVMSKSESSQAIKDAIAETLSVEKNGLVYNTLSYTIDTLIKNPSFIAGIKKFIAETIAKIDTSEIGINIGRSFFDN